MQRGALESPVREMTQVMEALRRVRAAKEIQGTSFGKDEFLTQKSELRMHVEGCAKK